MYNVGIVRNFASRPCVYQTDLDRIIEMLLAYRAATSIRAYPTTWRVRLLLTSRVWAPAQDARVWEDGSGQIVGLAMLWRRQPTAAYLVLDRFVHPQYATRDLVEDMLQWGTDRACVIVAEQKTTLTLYAGEFPTSVCPHDPIRGFGFTPLAPNPDEYNVYFAHDLGVDLPTPGLPLEYRLRSLQDVEELGAYQDLYSFAAVSAQHQQELLASDEYSHLVVVDAKGRFAAYCECSICRAEWQISTERIGWIDYIETKAELRRQGLGQAVLLAGLACLRDQGADTAMLVTISTNTPAIRLYAKTGFQRIEVSELARYEKQVSFV